MARESSTKNIEENRAPRVHIAYEVKTDNATVKVELPFVMGVMADLAGNSTSEEAQKELSNREFLHFDVHNFDDRMKALKPRVTMQVPNKIAGSGNIAVDLTFEKMDDFSPERIAERTEGLKELLKERQRLAFLVEQAELKAALSEIINRPIVQARQGNRALLEGLADRARAGQNGTKTQPDGGQ